MLKEEVPDGEYVLPIGKARMVQEGKDMTIIGWGAMMVQIQKAVDEAAKKGISCEVIDMRTLSPMDSASVVESVKRTGRAVVVQEAPKTCGVGAEIVARINEKALLSLQAPVMRVAGPDIIVPLPKGEDYYYVSPARILTEIERTVSF